MFDVFRSPHLKMNVSELAVEQPLHPAPAPRARFAWLNDPDSRVMRIVRPVGIAALFLTAWGLAVRLSHSDLFPTPGEVARGIVELIQKGLLFKYIVASLFRVTWGFVLAVIVGVPVGLVLGWYA